MKKSFILEKVFMQNRAWREMGLGIMLLMFITGCDTGALYRVDEQDAYYSLSKRAGQLRSCYRTFVQGEHEVVTTATCKAHVGGQYFDITVANIGKARLVAYYQDLGAEGFDLYMADPEEVKIRSLGYYGNLAADAVWPGNTLLDGGKFQPWTQMDSRGDDVLLVLDPGQVAEMVVTFSRISGPTRAVRRKEQPVFHLGFRSSDGEVHLPLIFRWIPKN